MNEVFGKDCLLNYILWKRHPSQGAAKLAQTSSQGRKWIDSDLGKLAIHATRKRIIGVQRELKSAGVPFRAFDVLNLGRYERQA